jgi:cytochrome oxidase assembly protein ShyY1
MIYCIYCNTIGMVELVKNKVNPDSYRKVILTGHKFVAEEALFYKIVDEIWEKELVL